MKKILSVFFLACCSCIVMAQDNVIDEIVWVVGDDAILRSDIETQRLYNQNEGVRLDGDPYCVIPEQMAIQKLYLNQAKIDSITVNENQVIQSVDQWMNMAVNQIGSREKLEEYFGKKFSQIKDERKEMVREQQVVQQMQHQLIGEIKLTPSEVRKYFSQLSQDSLPNIPTTVEVQIVTLEPKIPFEETDAIKARLRDFTEQVNSGKMEFSTLARLYSEDPGSASRGGELGFMSKTQLLPEFANVAFNLKDPKRVSQIVQTEYGYHIIQLIEKRGDRINCRHILLKPKVSDKELADATTRLDSLYNDLQANKFTFEEAATFVSYDKCFQVSCNLLTRSWSNLVDHCPRECYNILIADIINKICIYKTSFSPFFCHHQYRLPKLCTILRTVIHRYQCQWVFSCFISFKKHRYKHCHRSCYLIWSVLDVVLYKREPASVCFLKCISFFCNCKGN